MFGFLIVSMLATSFGGAFATAALAAEPEEVVEDSSGSIDNGVLGGLLAVGLLAVLANRGDDGGKTADSSKAVSTPQQSQSQGSTSQSTSSGNTASDEQLAFSLLNADRAANGLPALKWNTSLTRLAENYAQDMINRGYFSHYNPEGQSPFDRMKAAGISYSTAGENLAINTSVRGAETAFMNSSGHRANILNPNYTEVGIGVRYSANGQVYVVQEFIGR